MSRVGTDVGFPVPAAFTFFACGMDDFHGDDAVAFGFDFELGNVEELAEGGQVGFGIEVEGIASPQDHASFEGFADDFGLTSLFEFGQQAVAQVEEAFPGLGFGRGPLELGGLPELFVDAAVASAV